MKRAETKTAIARRLAVAINAHLTRFEADPKINEEHHSRARPFYHASAWGDRHRVRVRYVLYQGCSALSVEDAAKYLAWLDAGHVGQHYRAFDSRSGLRWVAS